CPRERRAAERIWAGGSEAGMLSPWDFSSLLSDRAILADGRPVESRCPRAPSMTRTAALVALHAAVALFGFAALFGKWLTLPPEAIVLGRTVVAATTLALALALQ